jgi:hypothetical protein
MSGDCGLGPPGRMSPESARRLTAEVEFAPA